MTFDFYYGFYANNWDKEYEDRSCNYQTSDGNEEIVFDFLFYKKYYTIDFLFLICYNHIIINIKRG